jgi:D-amino-acid dehydrogenase
MKLRPSVLPSLGSWGLRFLKNSSVARHLEATEANYRLAAHSLRQTRAAREGMGLQYQAGHGALKLFRDRRAMAGPVALAQRLATLGMCHEVLDADGAVAREPQLESIRDQIAGALYFPDDERGDALLFCRELARRFVVAAGCRTPGLLKTAGLSLPIQPVKGYSLTVSVDRPADLCTVAIVDDRMHAAVTPLGNRLRVAGTAEFAGFDTRLRADRVENLFRLLSAVYPRIADHVDRTKAEAWTGLRPTSCDGKPFIGPTHIKGLFVNAGHGHLGWTMAMGSARLLADLMTGRTPAIDPHPYRAMRFD